MEYLHTFPSGMRLIVKKINGLLSVTTGVIIKAGSSSENDNNNGISHFIEHMMFKGTKNRTAFDIADAADRIGAQLNAFTAKEMTCYYIKTTSEQLEKGMEILSDLLLNSVYDSKDIEKEKGVITEEIAMVEDTPDELCTDLLSLAYFGDKGLGRTILGSEDNVKSFKRADIIKYLKDNYTAENIVVSIAGNVDVKRAEELCEKYFSGFKKGKSGSPAGGENAAPPFNDYQKKVIYKYKDIEQMHIALAFPSCEYASPKTNAVSLINTVLGGGISSRLFQKLREEMGLAYSVYSFSSGYQNCGMAVVYAAVNNANYQTAADVLLGEIYKLKSGGITADEFLRAKEQTKGAFVFSQESTSSQMMLYGKYLLFTGEIFDFPNKINEINRVTMNDVNQALSENYIKTDMAAAYVGRSEELRLSLNS